MSVETICGWVGLSRQAWYRHRARQRSGESKEEAIAAQVRNLRHNHPRMGGRKLLYRRLRDWLVEQGYKLGRDRFFALLRRLKLLVRPKRRQTRTTWAGAWRCETCWPKRD